MCSRRCEYYLVRLLIGFSLILDRSEEIVRFCSPGAYTARFQRFFLMMSSNIMGIPFPSSLHFSDCAYKSYSYVKACRGYAECVASLDFAFLPTLQEIRISFLWWPVTEWVHWLSHRHLVLITMYSRHDISKSFWPTCSEQLAKNNIKLTDGQGRHWIPRLKDTK